MFRFQLISLSGKKFDDDVHEVILPTKDGEIGVLKDHMPLTSVATNGSIAVRKKPNDPDRAREVFAVSGGAIDISDNTMRVLVDEADLAEELNEVEIKKALERAERMRKDAKDQVSLDHAQALVDRQTVRLEVAGLKRRTKR
jgi:F-type H+-transporting ATPase subunit epsilon